MPHVGPILTVFGATGAQGGGLARAILADPLRRFRLRAVTRKPAFARRPRAGRGRRRDRVADLDDPSSVRRAMVGAHGAFCVTNFWEHLSPAKEYRQATAMAQAAKAEGVAHVIWSTLEDTREYVSVGSGRLPVLIGRYNVPHYDAKGEANHEFIDRGVPTTLLYTSFFWDNLIHFGMQPQRARTGARFVLPMGEREAAGHRRRRRGALRVRDLRARRRPRRQVGRHRRRAPERRRDGRAAGARARRAGVARVAHAVSIREPRLPGADDLANMFAFKREFEDAYCRSRSIDCARQLHPA
jgi:hypothetical protein